MQSVSRLRNAWEEAKIIIDNNKTATWARGGSCCVRVSAKARGTRLDYSKMARAKQQRVLILNLLAHLPRMKQPRVTLVNLRVEACPADVVVGSYRLGVLVLGSEFLTIVLEHFPSKSIVAGVVGVPGVAA